MSPLRPLSTRGLFRGGVVILLCCAILFAWVFRLMLFGWLLPESEVNVVNAASSAVIGGQLEIQGRVHDIGVLRPGESRRFGYRWRRGPEADFGLKVRLQSGRELDNRVGYINSSLYFGGESDEVFVEDTKICMKSDDSDMAPDMAALVRADPDNC